MPRRCSTGAISLHSTAPPDLPPAWRSRLSAYTPNRQTIGESGAAVYWLDGGTEPLFLKCEPAGSLSELPGEAERLRWLAAQGIPCPVVLDATRHGNMEFMLMTAVPGRDTASLPELAPERIVVLVADALRALHALDSTTCPFDHRAGRRMADARARLDAGLVDSANYESGAEPEALFAELLAARPAQENLVVTHGDACFPNFMVADGRFTGFIDCGRLGVADRYQDLALACRSLRRNFGPAPEAAFFRRYGIAEPDEAKLAFYRLLDEFF